MRMLEMHDCGYVGVADVDYGDSYGVNMIVVLEW